MFEIENRRDAFNAFPSGRQIAKSGSGLFWNFTASLFGAEPVHFEPVDPHLEYMRRNVAHYAGQQTAAPPPRRGLWTRAGAWVATVVAPKPEATVAPSCVPVAAKAVRVTKADAASSWLGGVLQRGPVDAVEIEALAFKAGISVRTLKRAKTALKAQSVRKGRKHWVWQLPFRRSEDVQGGKKG